MTALRRLIKPGDLKHYLTTVCEAFGHSVSIAVFEGERPIAAAGKQLIESISEDAAKIALRTEGGSGAAVVVVEPTAREKSREKLEPLLALLAQSLQSRIDAEEARRAVAAETLETYRELALLHRAAVDLNRSLHQTEVAEALLKEFHIGSESGTADAGVVFLRDPAGAGITPLRFLGGEVYSGLTGLGESRLLRSVMDIGKGEIVNDLAGDPRWRNELPGVRALLMIPLTAHESCSGALVLGRFSEGADFSAAELKRAETLSSVAAAALHNARLFEEVVEIKNYNESVLQNLTNGVITLDDAQRVNKTNAAALRILGRSGGDLIGLSLDEIFFGENQWVAESVGEAIAAGTSGDWIDRELIVGPDAQVSVNLMLVPLQRLEEASTGHILLLEDITREKRLKGTMVRFMSDRVVDKLLESEDSLLGGSAQEVSILFSDIRDFSCLSERLSAPDVVMLLNEYFSEMVDIIFDRGGTLDKFIGDAIMAVFGAPFMTQEDPDNAVETAIEMVGRLQALNRQWDACRRPILDIGIGINTGSVVAGTIGSQKRMDYTVIGDHVNLASRIEAANKYYGTKILISDHTLAQLNRAYRVREIDWVRVQGREQPIRVHEILDYHTAESFPCLERALSEYELGLSRYRDGKWEDAGACFAKVLERNPFDKPAQLFLRRCEKLASGPVNPEWSAVTDLSVRKSLSR